MSHWCQCLCPRASEPLNCATALDFLHRIRPCTEDFWKHPSSHRRLLDCPLIAREKKRYSNTFLTATLELSAFIGYTAEKQTCRSKIYLVHLLIVNLMLFSQISCIFFLSNLVARICTYCQIPSFRSINVLK